MLRIVTLLIRVLVTVNFPIYKSILKTKRYDTVLICTYFHNHKGFESQNFRDTSRLSVNCN